MFDSDLGRVRPVLGIDPGLSRCGYGVVVRERGAMRALACGVIRTEPAAAAAGTARAPWPTSCESLLARVPARSRVGGAGAVPEQRAHRDQSVGQASGLALVAAARAGIPVAQYSPNEVKLAVTGDGRADKVAVQTMVTRLLGLREVPRPADAADALALACCHLWRVPLAAQVAARS